MLDTFESPQDGFAGAGDTRMWDAMGDGYAAAGPADSDDPEDEILDDDLDDEEEDDLDDEDDEDDLDDDLDDDLVDLDDEYDTEDVERHHRGPGRGKYDDY